MDSITLIVLAFGLSMDAFAVSISNGIIYGDNIKKRQIALTALMFGLFQGMMPILGYYAGRAFSELISSVDHWIALILLGFIGGKMMRDGWQESKKSVHECETYEFTFKILLMQSIATSIDALAIGVGFAALEVNIFSGAAFIMVITFMCCLIGGFVGRKFNNLFASKATFFGGLILVSLGFKIFIEHVLA